MRSSVSAMHVDSGCVGAKPNPPHATMPGPPANTPAMPSQLEQLRELSTVVADTGDIEAIARFRPMDATTNPSLLLKAASLPAYARFVDEAAAKASGDGEARVADACDRLAVAVGGEIRRLIAGR